MGSRIRDMYCEACEQWVVTRTEVVPGPGGFQVVHKCPICFEVLHKSYDVGKAHSYGDVPETGPETPLETEGV